MNIMLLKYLRKRNKINVFFSNNECCVIKESLCSFFFFFYCCLRQRKCRRKIYESCAHFDKRDYAKTTRLQQLPRFPRLPSSREKFQKTIYSKDYDHQLSAIRSRPFYFSHLHDNNNIYLRQKFDRLYGR